MPSTALPSFLCFCGDTSVAGIGAVPCTFVISSTKLLCQWSCKQLQVSILKQWYRQYWADTHRVLIGVKGLLLWVWQWLMNHLACGFSPLKSELLEQAMSNLKVAYILKLLQV
jgi:hypothetical protein